MTSHTETEYDMRRCAARFFLSLCCLSPLLQRGSGVILVYERDVAEDTWVPVYQVLNNHQSLAGRRDRDIPSYLYVADPENACNADDVDPAPRVWEDNRAAPFFLLTNDAPCAPQNGYRNTTGSDGSGVVAKIFNAQMKGYSGIIVYADYSKEKVLPEMADGAHSYYEEWPRTTPVPRPIPVNITGFIKIAVHFVGHDDGARLAQYAYNTSSRSLYKVKVSSVVVDPTDRFGYHPRVAYPSYESPTWTSAPTSSSGSSSDSNALLWGILGPSFVIGAVIWLMRFAYRRHQIRQAAKAAAEQVMIAQALAQAAAEDELARILILREQQVRRFIEAFIARVQAAEEAEHVQANGVPLTPAEMQRLTQVKVTEESDDICPTCQQTFVVDEIKIVLSCSHVGHSACLTTWLTTYSRNCPVCRQPVETASIADPNPGDCRQLTDRQNSTAELM
ncbi:uncharacterized protein LOC129600962 isoform X2 [Paramacrobiotus metropolitanus]|uniref:uncharacterized protein LOC129600962 isoform X2 n=1 Tax=Paramacrobiotus metropolitanus TaxID=2943436 RepID=UPI002445ABEC|nr:uncharacterized protein LOC129600962 isoform X2 [Paramacrobiotus metropolitanus]